MLTKENRIADEVVYLKKPRYDKPKEIFKFVGNFLKMKNFREGASLLDVGCATGEFLYYIRNLLPNLKLNGMDISQAMIKYARSNVQGANFFTGSILDSKFFSKRKYDVVTCIGVISLFDDFEKPLKNLLSCVKKDGIVAILSIFNNDPIDVRTRYKRAENPEAKWESGWNIISVKTVENILGKLPYKLSWKWHVFNLPFALEKRKDDAMRAWTISTEKNPFQQVNGACQLLNFKMLSIHVIEPKKGRK